MSIRAAKSNKINMTEGPILGKLLQFSIPLILSSILQLLFNAADIVVVGRFAGKESLAAVGSTGSLINLLVNLFVGLSVGSNVVAASYFGGGDREKVQDTVHTSMTLSLICGVILTAVGVIFTRRILVLMGAPENVLELSALYLRIYFAGITATMIYNFGSALLRAKGDTKRPLYFLMASGALNVVLNMIFVIPLGMGVAGVALATVISQVLAAGLVVFCLMRESDEFQFVISKMKIDRGVFWKIIKIGVPSGVQGMLFSFSNVVIQSAINSFGEIAIAGNSAASNIEGFVWISMNGITQGCLTFVSQNRGAGNYERIRKVTWVSEFTVTVIGVVLGWTVFLLGKFIMGFYTDDPDVVKEGIIRLSVICTTYSLCGIMDVMAGAIRGLGHSVAPMFITLIGACLSRILWINTAFQWEKLHSCFGIFLSYPLSWGLTFVVLLMGYIVIYRKECTKLKEMK